MDKTIEGFLDELYVRSHSWETTSTYKNRIKKFNEFLLKEYDKPNPEIIQEIKERIIDVYELLRNFVVWLDKFGYRPSTITLTINAVKGYLRYCGIKIYSEDFKQNVRLPRKIKAQEVPLTREIILRSLRNVSPKIQTAILVAVASGMRIGEIVQLKISDIDFESKLTKIRIRAETTKTRVGRETFLTTEATQALKDYLKRYLDWSEGIEITPINDKEIFGRTSFSKKLYKTEKQLRINPVFSSKTLLQKGLLNSIKKVPDLCIKNSNGKYSIHFHGFRKFFRTNAGNTSGRDFAEALMGHSFYLDTYYNLPEEKKKELYLKAEPYLTISDFKKVEKDLVEMSERHDKLEKTVEDLKQYLVSNSIKIPETVA